MKNNKEKSKGKGLLFLYVSMLGICPVFVSAMLATACIMFSGCSSPMSEAQQGEEGTFSITINSGSSSNGSSRMVLPWDSGTDISDLDHTITISGGPGAAQKKEGVKEGETAQFTVAPGHWTVTVQAYKDGVLKAEGSASVDLQPGPNGTIQIPMYQAGNIPVAGVTLDRTTLSIAVGNSRATLTATITPANATNKNVTWASSDPGVATVSNGEVTPVSTGNATITVTTVDRNLTATCAVTVLPPGTPDLTGTVSIGFNSTNDGYWVNGTLKATYTGNGTSPQYQWYRGTSPISGAASMTYTIQAADLNNTIKVEVTSPGFTGSVSSGNTPTIDKTGIYTQTQLAAIGTDATTLGRSYILVNNISLTGTWTPIGTSTAPFTGTFDGNGHTITGLSISTSTDYQGLFGQIGSNTSSNATVKNLGLTNVSISTTTGEYIGGVAGSNYGTIQNCYVTSTGYLQGKDRIGGIAGVTSGRIENCYTTADVNVIDASGNGGGIVGISTGTVINCYATGAISGGSSNPSGGLVGCSRTGYAEVKNSVALNPSVTGDTDSGRVSGIDSTTISSSAFSNNHARDDMTVNSSTVSGGTANNKDGADVSPAQAATQSWWTTASPNGPGWIINASGTGSESSPWEWNASTNRPKLWFE